jgi:hypothetical protein
MPATIYEDTNPRDLRELLAEIHTGSAVVPEFQRNFVWEPRAIAELLTSLKESYPAGSILRVRNTQDHFKWRRCEGADQATATKPVFLVLDGQQRLTSLYQSLYGKGQHVFYLRLGDVLAGKEFEDALFWETTDSRRALRLAKPEVQYGELVLPLSTFIQADISAWVQNAAVARVANDDRNALFAEIARLSGAVVPIKDAIAGYRFPVVTLSDQTSAAAICTIFETLNRTGIKLTPFELLTARYSPRNVDLRALRYKAEIDHPILKEFEIDPHAYLQAITLRATGSVKRSRLMELTHDQVDQQWPQVCAALASGLEMLREDCGLVSPKWLPYATQLVPLAAVIAERPINKGAVAGERRRKLARWFWGASLGQKYEFAAGSQAERDFSELVAWLDGGKAPASAEVDVSAINLEETTPRQRAVYRAMICLLLQNGARDFHTRSKIDARIMSEQSVDDHHIFPLDYLGVKDRRSPEAKFDSILNRTLIDGKTNKSINARAPSAYLADMDKAQSKEPVDEILSSHLISGETLKALRGDDFELFRTGRRDAFNERLKNILWPTERVLA